jgi:hypothetical protein
MAGIVADVDVRSESEEPRGSFAEPSFPSRRPGTPPSQIGGVW